MAFNPWIAGAGGIGTAMMFDNKNPADAASKYFDQIPGLLHQSYDPYIQRGNRAGDVLEGQYGSLLNDPGAMLNRMGQGYQQSPGFKFALQQALQGAGHAAAAGGMAGSPQHEQQSMELATNLANQDYGNWIQRALGLYGQGLSGEQGLYGTGAQAGMGLGSDLANAMASRASLAFQGQAQQNQNRGDIFSNLAGLAAFAGL